MADGHGSPASLIKRRTGAALFTDRVTAVPGANQFTCPGLAGLGAGFFSDATAPFYARVVRDAGGAGAPPQGEQRVITGYVTATGVFTTLAFSAAVDIGDEVEIIVPTLSTRFDDAVWYHSGFGVAGTGYSNGTPQNPSNSLADVRTMCTARNIKKIKMQSSGVLTTLNVAILDADMQGIYWEGDMCRPQIVLNGKSVSSCTFRNLIVGGTAFVPAPDPDAIYLHSCIVGIQTNPVIISAWDSYFVSTAVTYLAKLAHYPAVASNFTRCWSDNGKFSVPNGVIARFIDWHGSLTISDMAAAGGGFNASLVTITGQAKITIAASCTGGDIYCPQNAQIDDLSGGAVSVHREAGDTRLIYEGRVTAVPGANQFTLGDLAGTIPAGMLVDAANPWSAYVKQDALGTGVAPQGEIKVLTGATNAAVFTTAAFSAAVAAGDIIQIVHPSLAATISQSYGNQQIKADTAAILAALGGAIDARFFQSASGPVEEDAIQDFDITIFDVDLGAVLQANIDITSITAVMEKSTGGGAYSSVGITQPSFAKADGRVYVAYRFLAAEWAVGDMYRLGVTGISATVDAATVYCPAMVWSNRVDEAADVFNAVQKMWKQVDSADVNITAILANETDVLNLPAAANTTYMLNHLRLKSADPGANTVLVRLYEEVNGALTNVDTFTIGTGGALHEYTDYFSLMDMFSLAHCAGNNIKITVQASGGGPYAVTAQYQYATATV